MTAKDEQTTLWNGPAARAWLEAQELLEELYKPIEELLAEAVSARAPRRVLDVGCGPGSTTFAVARRLGSKVECTGADISEPMIAAARARAERDHLPVRFICADVQEHAFEPASFDTIMSRFGVMFFNDPARAFANLRRAATTDGELRVITWRSPAENPFMTAAERAAAPLLPDLPPRVPDAPGQFSLADADRVSRILTDSGWADIDIEPSDVVCTFPEKELLRYVTRFGPVGRALDEADDRKRAEVAAAIRPAFDTYVHGPHVRFIAACWMVSARARASA
jgi:SAM-dependent methyltransferase